MPWKPADALSHTKKATTAHLQRTWSTVANRVLKDTGDDARAIREANSVVGKRIAAKSKTKLIGASP